MAQHQADTKAAQPAAANRARRRAYLPAAQRRQSILDAAQRVFARASYNGARIRDIASEAGVNQATLFEHFPSKEALFEEAVVRPLIAAINDVHEQVEVIEAGATLADRAEIARGSITRHIEDMERILPLLTATLFSDLEHGRSFYQHHLAPVIRQRGEAMRKVIREGYDPSLVGLVSFGMLFALAMDRIFTRGEGGAAGVLATSDLSEIAGQFNRLSASGFAGKPDRVATRVAKGSTTQEMPGGL